MPLASPMWAAASDSLRRHCDVRHRDPRRSSEWSRRGASMVCSVFSLAPLQNFMICKPGAKLILMACEPHHLKLATQPWHVCVLPNRSAGPSSLRSASAPPRHTSNAKQAELARRRGPASAVCCTSEKPEPFAYSNSSPSELATVSERQRTLRDSASQRPSPSALLPLAHCREGPTPARSSKPASFKKTQAGIGWHPCLADRSSCAGMSRCVTHFVSQALHLQPHQDAHVQGTIRHNVSIVPLPLQHFGPGLRNHAWQRAIRRQHAPI